MSTTPQDPERDVVVGRIGRPHGVRGEVSLELRTDEPDRRFADGAVLTVRGAPGRPAPEHATLTVAATRWHQERLLVRFEQLTDRDAAERARDLLLEVTIAADSAPVEDDEFYDFQIVGLSVVTEDGTPAGTVKAVLHPGAQDLLVVARNGQEDALVPFVSALVPEVDLAGGRLVVADRPGLLSPFEDE
ncbi:ribosome maturation factor RimM [Nocardioides sp. HDW12B]|uniref:ribosome maturation factor RimM n=1 Tax=Nocardioides sp. HDW12B TaxID=2714939 RepID=UPI00140A7576|nr:ribosome maturation factor RimM [Nocardioides sp. HDW12B]QIK66986.1 ribosome maturation factor RimM [Nocardioides sp. HDW12B]